MYLTRKYEQDAYVNGLYGLLTSNEKGTFDIGYCVEQSDVFGALIELQKSYNLVLNANQNNLDFIEALKVYKKFGYNYNRILKEANDAISEIKRKIGRTIKKYANDTKKVNDSFDNNLYRKPYTTDKHLRFSEYHINE